MKRIALILLFTFTFVVFANADTMSKQSYAVLMKAQKLLDKQKYKEAKNLLLPLLKKELNNYEKSYVLQTLANIAINQDDYKKTAKYYEEIIKLKSFEEKNLERIKLSLAKIYLSINKYDKSVKLLETLLSSKTLPKSDIYENLLYATYYKKDFRKSISYSKELFNLNKKKKESWYQILYSSYVELKQYPNAINTLKIMVKKWHGNETYWLQLIALYQETKNYKKALSTFELAYKKNGVDRKKNTLYFVNILIENGLYYKAALELEYGMKEDYIENNSRNFELLISCYDYAKQKDKVIQLLSKSKYAKTNKYQLLLGNIYYNKREYKKSIEVLKNITLSKGSKDEGQKNILLALNYYELDDKKASSLYLKKAIANPYEKRRALNIEKSLDI